MTPKKKLFSLLGLIAVFFIAIPILILFSLGYRLDSGLRLVKTGGIYLADIGSDAIIMINGKNIERSGVFEQNILIRNLVPKIYYVRIEKDGFRPWKKNVKVLEQKVEVCYPLLLPLKPDIEHIPKYIFRAENKKKKKRKLNEEYSEAIKIFQTYDDPVKSLIPGWENSNIKKYRLNANRRLYKKVFLTRQGKKIYGKWTGMDDNRPFFINSAEGKLIYSSDKNILSFGFFPGRNDSILVLLENLNLYAVEIDTRFEIQNIYLIATNCSSFAAINEFLYYFSAGALFRVDLES